MHPTRGMEFHVNDTIFLIAPLPPPPWQILLSYSQIEYYQKEKKKKSTCSSCFYGFVLLV